MKKLLIPFLFLSIPVLAQQQNTFYFMNGVAQQSYLNPALIPDHKVTIGLPGMSSIYTSAGNSGFTYNDAFSRRPSDDSLVFELDRMANKLGNKNYISQHTALDGLFIGFDVGPRWYFTFNVSVKSMSRLMYPRDLINLAKDGNAGSIGEELLLSPQVEGLAYREMAVGLAHKVNERLSFGARLKYLRGAANITTDQSQFSLRTDEDFSMTIQGDMLLKTSGINQFEDGSIEINNVSDALGVFSNTGFGIDLGASWQPNDDFKFALSIVDLGYINWKNDILGYGLTNGTASYTFRGFDIAKLIDDEDAAQAEFDELEAAFDVDEVNIDSYSTWLPTRFLLSGEYFIRPNLRTGLLLSSEIYRGRFNGSASVNVARDFGRRMTFALSWSAMHRQYNNFGAGLNLNFAPIQFYVAADNAMRLPFALMSDGNINNFINQSKVVNVRAGINLIFGYRKGQDKLLTPDF
ncbi:MAG: DUF5723 family protein [Cyclobacteriaceae bacterium]